MPKRFKRVGKLPELLLLLLSVVGDVRAKDEDTLDGEGQVLIHCCLCRERRNEGLGEVHVLELPQARWKKMI